jgi:hypothetical protein
MVEKLGMYGEQVGYIYVDDKKPYWEEDTKVSEKYKSQIDMTVKQILKVYRNKNRNLTIEFIKF